MRIYEKRTTRRKGLPFYSVIVAVSAVGIALAGCSSGSSESAVAEPATDQETSEQVEVEAAAGIQATYVAPTLGNAADVAIADAWGEACSALGFVTEVRTSENDSAEESRIYTTLVSSGVGALVGAPVDSAAVIPAIQAANQAGVPVFMNGRAASGGDVELTVLGDQISLGTTAAEAVVQLLEEKNGAPQGTVLNLQGEMSSTNAALRDEGIMSTFSKYPDIEVISRDTKWDEKAFFDITLSIASQQEIDAIVMASDTVAQGVPQALKQANKFFPVGDPNHVILVGIDGDPKTLEMIRGGEWDATAYQPLTDYGPVLCRYMATFFSEGSTGLSDGQVVSATGLPEDGARVVITDSGLHLQLPSFLVTTENAADSNLWGNATAQ